MGSLSSSMASSMTNLSSSMVSVMATTGSNLFKGDQTISGSIIPAVNSSYDLGSPTNEFRHLYLSSASLYIDGTKVLGSTTQELQITTDTGQSFKILEAGSDTITLQAADGNITLATSGGGDVILDPTSGVIALKGTTTLYAGNKILSSDGNAIQIGNSVTMTGSLIVTGFIETQELRTTYISSSILYRSGSTKFGDELTDTHSFTGSLSVSGSISIPESGLVSGSSQITYSGLSGVPSGIISGSSQLPSGIVSSSAQTIANLPSGVVSGSAQILNGTGFVKTSGASITYDNSTYLTTGTASSTYLPLAGGTLTNNLTINGGGLLTLLGAKIGGDAGGTIDFNYNTGGTPLFTWWGGTTSSKFSVTSAGAATLSSSLTAESGYFNKPSATNGTSLIVRQTTAGGNGNQDIGLLVDIQGANNLDRILNLRYYDGSTYTSRFSVLRDGKVGVGYLTPTVSLQVSGTIATGDGDNGWGRFLYDAGTVKIQASKNGTDPIGISFWTQASGGTFSEKVSITPGGNVGVGNFGGNPVSSLLELRNSEATLYDQTVDSGQDSNGVSLTIRNNDTSVVGSFSQINMQVSGDSGRALGRIVTIRMGSATSDMAFVTEDANVKSEKLRIASGGTLTSTGPGIVINRPATSSGEPFVAFSKDGVSRASIYGGDGTAGLRFFSAVNTFSGNIMPSADATHNLGSTSLRWNNLYTTDLHLSNEGKQNVVDGTWGDWTLQEGENDIYMLNNRSGEKFKIKLEKIIQ